MIATDARRLLELYQGRETFHAVAHVTGVNGDRRVEYRPVDRALTIEDLERHLRGEVVLGVYLLHSDSTVRFASIDLDTDEGVLAKRPDHLPTLPVIRRLHDQAVKLGVPRAAMALAFSGRKGHHLHVFFAEAVPAVRARQLMEVILGSIPLADSVKPEVFPKQDKLPSVAVTVDADGAQHFHLGNLIKLPLAVHPLTGKRAELLDDRAITPMTPGELETVLSANPIPERTARLSAQFQGREPEFRVARGERHDYWVWRASRLRNAGLLADEITTVLQREALDRFDGYMATQADLDHLREIVEWFAAKPAGKAMATDYLRASESVTRRAQRDADRAEPEPERDLPEFPLDALPAEAEAYVRTLATGGLPVEYLAPAALGVMAAALGGLAELEVAEESWVEPLIFWYALIGLPGTGKTPSLQALRAPLDAIEQPWRATYRQAMATWRALPTELRRQQPRPVSRRLVLGNHTFEKLIRILEPGDNAAGVLLLADELRSTIAGLGQYKRGGGSDRADFLSLWSGTPISYDRVSDDVEIYVGRPVVGIVGGLQPHVLHILDGDDGLRDRFCLSWFAANPTDEPPEIADASAAGQAWSDLIQRLAKGRPMRRTRPLLPDAREVFQDARRGYRRVQIDNASPDHVASWAAKAPSHLARHALLLAEVDGLMGVDADTMHRAHRIVSYFGAHCRALPIGAPNLMLRPLDRAQDEAVDRLADFLRRQPEHRASRREVQRTRVAGVRTPDDLQRLVTRYAATHHGCVVEETAGGQQRQMLYAPGHQPRGAVAKVSPPSPGVTT